VTEEGLLPIEQLKKGDMVLSKNEHTGELGYCRVARAFARTVAAVLLLTFASGQTLEATAEHPFQLADGIGGWVQAEKLTGHHVFVEALSLETHNSMSLPWDRVVSIASRQTPTTVYNLHVEGWNNFFVTEGLLWVHNCSGSVSRGKMPGKTVDPTTGKPVQRFIVDPKGNTMIEPVGGQTKPWGSGGLDTHTTYANNSPYQRLDSSHGKPHGHAHLQGTGPGRRGTGPSLDTGGNVVPNNTSAAHWPVNR